MGRVWCLLSIIAVTSCGRISFDPRTDGNPSDPRLASLQLTSGGSVVPVVMPVFDPNLFDYTADVGLALQSVQITATPVDPTTTITIDMTTLASGSPSSKIALALGPTTITVVGTARDGATARYALTIVRAGALAQAAYVKASNTDVSDWFGYALSVSGDTLAVSAYFEDSAATGVDGNQASNGAADSGAVYVFTRTGATWTQQAYLKASNTERNDQFGVAVSLSGDTLAVGAWYESSAASGIDGNQADNSALRSGAVYVFVRSGASWSQQAYVKASNTGAGDQFGFAVSVSGDTLAVGATSEDSAATGIDGNQADNSAPDAGAVYVFTRNGATWTQQAYIKASNAEQNDAFGSSVSVSGNTIAVGAPGESSAATDVGGNQADNSASHSGAVYVFERTGTTWSQQAYIKASNTDPNDLFGLALSVSGDTLAVGAPLEDSAARGVGGDQANNTAADSGAVYVFVRTAGTWTQQAYVKASNADAGDYFGGSVSVSGDTLAVGAVNEGSAATGVGGDQADNSSLSSGAVYLFTRTAGVWSQLAYVKASNTDPFDLFGSAVSVSGDTLAVGAYVEDSAATGVGGNQADNSSLSSGAAYVFR